MNEIESVKPTLTVILDENDFIINSTGAVGKAMAQAVLPLAASAKKITIITDGEMRVMKRNKAEENGAAPGEQTKVVAARMYAAVAAAAAKADAGPDIQDSFVADLESGKTGEIATGEQPNPTPGPSDPVKIPTRRKPQIFQDAAAPPAPELVEAEMDRLLAEAQQAEADAAKAVEDRRFQAQQAVQAQIEPEAAEEPVAPRARKREPRQLATTGQTCGNCGGSGQSVRVDSTGGYIPDEHGQPLSGVCQVCGGQGRVMAWGRGRSTRIR